MLLGLYYTGIRATARRRCSWVGHWSAARRYPERPARIDERRRLSYAEFNAWSNRLAHAPKAEGVIHGSVVAVMLENRIEVLAVLGALAKLGAIAALVKARHFVVGDELRDAFGEVRDDLENDRPAPFERCATGPRATGL